jgi:hypothetical protein
VRLILISLVFVSRTSSVFVRRARAYTCLREVVPIVIGLHLISVSLYRKATWSFTMCVSLTYPPPCHQLFVQNYDDMADRDLTVDKLLSRIRTQPSCLMSVMCYLYCTSYTVRREHSEIVTARIVIEFHGSADSMSYDCTAN